MTVHLTMEVVLDLGSVPDALVVVTAKDRKGVESKSHQMKSSLIDDTVKSTVDKFRLAVADLDQVSVVQVRSVVGHVDDEVKAVKRPA